MSFRSVDVDLESQAPFSDSPEFDRATDAASNLLLDLTNSVSHLSKLVTLLEGRTSNSETSNKNCEKCTRIIETATGQFKELSESCKELNALVDDEHPGHVFTRDRVARETKSLFEEFQSLQERFKNINSSLNEQTKASLGEQTDLLDIEEPQQQRQEMVLEQDVINNEEFVYQQALIREREEEIQNIEHGIQELNDIFRDLGTIVQEQGTMVDNIETNIYSVGQSTRSAAGELKKALRYQRSASKKSCYLLVIIVSILLIVILGIVI
ncbi:CYFA0S10e04016g1_1 [Cyberlindnera fabianii]|uniref:CYFA0S10e04016g1_1 n=1 Tax=Cyberlindnera fabianii TaxID=36022 RepID=A0A061AZ38_CYBFA|nr:CYFA0S10e04016g1_1 [Cyberlindnera fabianii]